MGVSLITGDETKRNEASEHSRCGSQSAPFKSLARQFRVLANPDVEISSLDDDGRGTATSLSKLINR